MQTYDIFKGFDEEGGELVWRCENGSIRARRDGRAIKLTMIGSMGWEITSIPLDLPAAPDVIQALINQWKEELKEND